MTSWSTRLFRLARSSPLLGLLAVACGVPSFDLPANGTGGHAGARTVGGAPAGGAGIAGAVTVSGGSATLAGGASALVGGTNALVGGSSATGGIAGSGGNLPSGGAVATGGRTGDGCSNDGDCREYSATKVCDSSFSPGRCVECLPGVTQCGPGLYCGQDKACHIGCATPDDCGAADCDASVCNKLACDASKHQCTGCTSNANCPLGTRCDTATKACVPGCTDSTNCAAGWVCCASACVNLKTDARNCASCGTSCAQPNSNVACANGVCKLDSCVSGYADCNGKYSDGCEVDVLDDPANCSACKNTCSATLVCRDGTCTTSHCSTTELDCDGIPGNGCETDVSRDVLNCGGCAKPCSTVNGTPSCMNGACSITCKAGWGDCNSNPADGCETNLLESTTSCGACGNACLNEHGTTSCVFGACVPVCGTGFLSCDGNAENGCEQDILMSAAHCGSCSGPCAPYAFAASACADGACKMGACNEGYADCNTSDTDGCEVDTNKDALNCGKCGSVCPSDHGTAACSLGKCAIACGAGYLDCTAASGCETDGTSDIANCGACGNKCGGLNPVCTTSKCLPDIIVQQANVATGTGCNSGGCIGSSGTTVFPTIAHKLALGSSNHRVVIAMIAGRGSSVTDAIPIPKYNNVKMTAYGTPLSYSGDQVLAYYYILDSGLPADPGTYNVTFSPAGVGQNFSVIANIIEFDNVDQTAPIASAASKANAGSVNPISVALAVPTLGDYTLEAVGAEGTPSCSSTPVTQTLLGTSTFFGSTRLTAGVYAATSSSQTLSWTMSNCNASGQYAVALARATN